MNIKEDFLEWLENEHHRIATRYRQLLYNEIVEAKKVMGENNNLYKPILLSCLKQIALPPYNEYKGLLDRASQKVLFEQARKVDKQAILHEMINEYLKS
jgi:hypothetical protein